MEVAVVDRPSHQALVVLLGLDPSRDLRMLAVRADDDSRPHLLLLSADVLHDGADHCARLDEQTVDPRAHPQLGATFHRTVDDDLVENDATRRYRVGSRRSCRSLDADVIDPHAMPVDATETGGLDALQHAKALQGFDRVEGQKVGGDGVAGKLVSVDEEDLAAL